MNEGQNRLIQMINSLEESITDIKIKLNENKEIGNKAIKIKQLAEEILTASKIKEKDYNNCIKMLNNYNSELQTLKFEELSSSTEEIAHLIARNLPDDLGEITKDDFEMNLEQVTFKLIKEEPKDTKKHTLEYSKIELGEVRVGTNSQSEENDEKRFEVVVYFNKTKYTNKSEEKFKLEYPNRIYKIINYIHLCTSYKE